MLFIIDPGLNNWELREHEDPKLSNIFIGMLIFVASTTRGAAVVARSPHALDERGFMRKR